MTGIRKVAGRITAGKLLLAAIGIVATGFLLATGQALYHKLAQKEAVQ